MVTLTIKVTKDVLKRSAYCGMDGSNPAEHCAIAVAVRDIFPEAAVSVGCIFPFPELQDNRYQELILLPPSARGFIRDFDTLRHCPQARMSMPEFSFEVEIPDAVIERIDITAVTALLQNHPTLQLQTT